MCLFINSWFSTLIGQDLRIAEGVFGILSTIYDRAFLQKELKPLGLIVV